MDIAQLASAYHEQAMRQLADLLDRREVDENGDPNPGQSHDWWEAVNDAVRGGASFQPVVRQAPPKSSGLVVPQIDVRHG